MTVIPKPLTLEDICELKKLYSLKREYLEIIDLEMKLYINSRKINDLYESELEGYFDPSANFQIDMERTLEIIHKIDCLIYDIEFGKDQSDICDPKTYAEYILFRDHKINFK